jgi:predicted short-subunit dehydrogenase-like oxidoreductase (DUF2520 family)
MTKKISVIGSGNVATYLATCFFENGCIVNEIFSRNIENATILANKTNAKVCATISKFDVNVNCIIIAVNDSGIQQIAQQLAKGKAIIIHCSGAVSIDAVSKNADNFGVLYPLQTFSKHNKPHHLNFPFYVEGNSATTLFAIKQIAEIISKNVLEANSNQRRTIHLSAIFANNFVNHLLGISSAILETQHVKFHNLQPLLLETIEKATTSNPFQIQTGPAIRNDEPTLEMHRKILENYNANFTSIYNIITASIQNIKLE